MKMTVTNESAVTINTPDEITGGSGPAAVLAVGGAKKFPLPYPFGHIGPLAASASSAELGVNARDFRKGGPVNMASTLEPGEEWNQLVNAGIVSLVIADDSLESDTEGTALGELV